MPNLKREKMIEFVSETPGDKFWNVKVSRIIPGKGAPAYMKAEVHCSDDNGDYDPEMKVLDIDGVDTLDLQMLLIDIKEATSELTNVHVQQR